MANDKSVHWELKLRSININYVQLLKVITEIILLISELECIKLLLLRFFVQSLSHVWLTVTPWTAAHQASLSFTSHGACSNSCLSSQWCHPIISFSVIPSPSYLSSFPASETFWSQLFASGGQSIGDSASASVLPMNIQDWFSLGLTGLISLQSKGLSRVFSNTSSKASVLQC